MLIKPNTFSPKRASGFVVLEGLNGAGKTTLQNHIVDFLRQEGQQTITTREPGATALGKTLRSLVLEHTAEPPCEMSELFMFAADRAQHVERVIRPGLEKKAWVISDRYYYSTTAFQGYGRGIDLKKVNEINSLAISGVYPDLVILLDIDPQQGLERIQSRQAKSGEKIIDNFEKESLEFHTRIRLGFLEIAEKFKEPFLIIDAAQGPDAVWQEARAAISKLLVAQRD